ncbi:MAG: 6-phosphofructokinase [Chlamydiae bacterium]|nr:6-phosphofructokinase [Chlamydiota bacterium]MBI3277410.1 6-phosphofructokinase [Chlamydiota bacterium]
MKKRIGVLTGGGDCPGLNAVLRVITKTAIQDFGMEVYGFEDGYAGLVENRFRPLSSWDVSGILTLGGTILGTSNRANPFKYPILKKQKLTYRDLSNQALRHYRKLGLEAIIAIGGDGTLSIASHLMKMGFNMVGVPKTIDNDLKGTDFTFGFDSAVAIVTEAMDRIHTTAESHHRVMIVEVMGRYAGWIALYGGMAGGGDIILIPEIPFDFKKVFSKIKERHKMGKNFSIVVVAEGAYPFRGHQIVKQKVKGSPDPIRLGGISALLSEKIEKKTGFESRFTVLGHLQRGGSPTAFDRILATRFGYEALQLIVKGDFGKMVALQGNEIESIPIEQAIGDLKKVPLDHPLIKVGRSLGISFGN